MDDPTRPDDLGVPVGEAIQVASPTNLFNTDPVNVMRQAYQIALPLAKVLRQAKLVVRIGNRDYVEVEGWTMLGSMLGVFPVVEWSRPMGRADDEPDSTPWGWEASVEAHTMSGAVVGRAEAQCTRSEKTWARREDYALRSMAQTRAISRALRAPLGFIVALAGFQATAAEEMPRDE
jgi:hypothetical protein